jgi:predicted MFS family arabinose efflux permease
VDCAWGIEKIGYVLVCYGVVDAISSITFGSVIRRVGRLPVFIFGALVNLAVITAFFLWTPTKDNAIVFFVLAGGWGVGDAIWQTQING